MSGARRFLTEEQVVAILAVFGSPSAGTDSEHIIETLEWICTDYMLNAAKRKRLGELEPHRRRIASILSAATKLRTALAQEKLISDLVGEENDRFIAQLDRLIARSKRLVEEPLALPVLRDDLFIWDGGDESYERRFIWKPIFRLWQSVGRHLGATRTGPLHDLIAVVHSTVHLPKPESESVYRAIRDFKRGPSKIGNRATKVWQGQIARNSKRFPDEESGGVKRPAEFWRASHKTR